MLPFTQKVFGEVIQRVFQEDCNENDLVWHKDKMTRDVKVIAGVDWKFQHDNDLPFVMKRGMRFRIEKESFHRILRGSGRLILEIRETNGKI